MGIVGFEAVLELLFKDLIEEAFRGKHSFTWRIAFNSSS